MCDVPVRVFFSCYNVVVFYRCFDSTIACCLLLLFLHKSRVFRNYRFPWERVTFLCSLVCPGMFLQMLQFSSLLKKLTFHSICPEFDVKTFNLSCLAHNNRETP